MVLSMTGYGKATGTFEGKKLTVEIRSLNSKGLDLNIKTNSVYREKELELRTIIAETLDRGKVEVSISAENSGETKSSLINKQLASAYYSELREVADSVGAASSDLMSIVMRMPDVLSGEKDQLSDEETHMLFGLVREAAAQLAQFRRQEGEQLRQDFLLNINRIKSLLEEVPKYETERIDIVRERMRSGLEKLGKTQIDENRFEQELIFYLEKMDISEEKMRLLNHLNYFVESMDLPACGKKLGFISQEIGREINTLGSKSYHVELQKLVVEMKDHLEKIKEQVLNTL